MRSISRSGGRTASTSPFWDAGSRLPSINRAPLVRGIVVTLVISSLGAMLHERRDIRAAHLQASAAESDYPLFNYDAMRTGINPHEGGITPTTIQHLKRIWNRQLPAAADSAPIELAGITLPGNRRADLLYLTGKTGITYALDAHSGSTVWTFDPTRGEALRGYQITTSTPAADPSREWIYTPSPDGRVHKLAAATGTEASGWPIAVTTHANVEKISSSLNILGHTLLVTTSGYVGDFGHYEGHLVAVNTVSRSVSVFNTLCSAIPRLPPGAPGSANYCPSEQSGVWARDGSVVDTMPGSPTQGQIYIVTGNGPYDGRSNWGDSVLRLQITSSGLRLVDAYTPTSQADLNTQDADLGSTTPILLPRQSGPHPWLAVQGGKDDVLRLLDRANLSGRGGPGHLGGELLSIPMPQHGPMRTAGLTWQDTPANTWVFLANENGLAAVRLTSSARGVTMRTAWMAHGGFTSPILAGGMLFAAGNGNVEAFDPLKGSLLWSSGQPSAGGSIGGVHWQSPIVVNSMLFMPDDNGGISGYGLR